MKGGHLPSNLGTVAAAETNAFASAQGSATASPTSTCFRWGEERWAVKTLSDLAASPGPLPRTRP